MPFSPWLPVPALPALPALAVLPAPALPAPCSELAGLGQLRSPHRTPRLAAIWTARRSRRTGPGQGRSRSETFSKSICLRAGAAITDGVLPSLSGCICRHIKQKQGQETARNWDQKLHARDMSGIFRDVEFESCAWPRPPSPKSLERSTRASQVGLGARPLAEISLTFHSCLK